MKILTHSSSSERVARDCARPDGHDAHITSLVVLATPAVVHEIEATINGFADAEVHIADPGGKLVVSLETDALHQVTDYIDTICALKGVISATLVYHQFENNDALDQLVDASMSKPEKTAHRETEL